ncbi:MAG: cobalamin-independent methionine synthase II family protein [Acetobacteraceae bacterium]
MQRSTDRILTTHTGSLPRPSSLVELYVRKARGEPVDAELATAGHAAMEDVVRRQREAGIDIGNNGEQQREAFFLYVRSRMSGFGGSWTRPPRQDVERYPALKAAIAREMAHAVMVSAREDIPTAIGEVRYTDRAAVEHECADFRATLDAMGQPFVEPFLTAPSPGIVAAAMRNDYYPDEAAYLAALGEALRVEYETIVNHGFLLQLDCPDLAMERHFSYQDRPLADFQGFVERVVGTINMALANIPREKVRLHVCWGNYEGPHDCDVELREIFPILRRLKVGGFVLPFANPRHAHEYRVLKEFPLDKDQIIVAGVIDSVTNFVEHPEAVAERIERVVDAVGDPSRVQAGTDCGFDTSAGMRRVASDVVWAKLAALSEGARIASGRVFPR